MKSLLDRLAKDGSNVRKEIDAYKAAVAHNKQRIKDAKRMGLTKPWQKGNVWHIRHDNLKESFEHMPKLWSYAFWPLVLIAIAGWVI